MEKYLFQLRTRGEILDSLRQVQIKTIVNQITFFFLMVAPTHSATFYAQRKSQEIFLYVHKNKCVTLQWSISATFDHSWAKTLFYQECRAT